MSPWITTLCASNNDIGEYIRCRIQVEIIVYKRLNHKRMSWIRQKGISKGPREGVTSRASNRQINNDHIMIQP